MDNYQRHIAHLAEIREISDGKYHQEEGLKPNFLITPYGRKMSRVNIVGVLISELTEGQGFFEMIMDDGTGSIQLRSFESYEIFQGVNLGDVVRVIGRPREFNNMMYIIVEVIKKIDNQKWVEVSKLQIQKINKQLQKAEGKSKTSEQNQDSKTEEKTQIKTEIIEETVSESEPIYRSEPIKQSEKSEQADINKRVYSAIEQLDKGDGADYELVLQKSGKGAEKIVSKLMVEGEIFETSPGKLKILK